MKTAEQHNAGQVGHYKFTPKPKQPKAPWTRIKTEGFEAQQARLRPEDGKAGGVKARSAPEEVRMAIYREIAAMYKLLHPFCECCVLIRDCLPSEARDTTDIHHIFGRDGYLLFDPKGFKSSCRPCHTWIDANRELARKLGLLCEAGQWRKTK